MGCLSQSATTLLAVARFLRIQAPFFKINKRVFLALFVLYSFIMTVVTVAGKYLIVTAEGEAPGVNTRVIYLLKDVCFYLNLGQCAVGILFSVLCVSALYRRNPESEEEVARRTHALRRAGCVTILLLNLPYLCSFSLGLVAMATRQTLLRELMFNFVPIVTSAFNPVVLCWRNRGVRRRVGHVWGRVGCGARREVVRRTCGTVEGTKQETVFSD